MKTVLTSSTHIDKAKVYDFFHPWIGTGLLTSTGRKWQSRRKLLTPSFHFRVLEDFIDVFNRNCDLLLASLNQHKHKPKLDIYSFVVLSTLDIICESVMGVKANAQINYDNPPPYVEAVKRTIELFHARMLKLYLWPDIIYRLSADGREHTKCMKIVHDFSENVIRERRAIYKQKLANKNATSNTDKKKPLALLDSLLETSDNGKNLSDTDIREEIDTFTFEGHDTTAVGISWALFLLGHNPHIQAKMNEEADQILGPDANKHPTIAEIQSMKYLDCVIKECQRIFPSVPVIARETNTDIVLADGKIIPPGVTVAISPFLMNRDPQVFPDPETMDPTRFFPENTAGRSPFAYIPFSAGPRNCIGQKFAQLKMKMVVSRVVRSFAIESLVPQDKVRFTIEVITLPKAGVPIRIAPRTAEAVLSSSTLIDKASLYDYLHPWLGTGLLTSTGRKWQTRRKLLTPSFHFRILDGFIPVFNEQYDVLIEILNQNVKKSSIDIYSFITLCTLDIICESVMGVKVNAQINYQSPSPYGTAIENWAQILSGRDGCPVGTAILAWLEIGWVRPLCPDWTGVRSAQCPDRTEYTFIISIETDQVIRERKLVWKQKSDSEIVNNQKKKLAFLDLLFDASDNGKNLSDSDIREEVDTFMFEGHDTTAAGISWALFLLGHNQDIQEKVHEELDSIFGDDQSRHATIDDLKRMKYLDCVIKVI
uniref:Cytochrome P450 n=1 Tax=Strigamia maritima TaxID=126957 RepID=T1J572_STRMM